MENHLTYHSPDTWTHDPLQPLLSIVLDRAPALVAQKTPQYYLMGVLRYKSILWYHSAIFHIDPAKSLPCPWPRAFPYSIHFDPSWNLQFCLSTTAAGYSHQFLN